MDFAPLINAFRQIGGWHSFGVLLALLPVAFAVFVRGWAPGLVECGLAIALAGAAGFTMGSLFHWLAGTALPRWRAANSRVKEDAALVKQLAFIGAEERGVLGGIFVAGRREMHLDWTHPAVRELRERGLLIRTGPTSHRVPDAIWRTMEARPMDFPPGHLAPPSPHGWLAS